ncbi:GNAT family N-acetyltransferase [Neolewinella aurantiaca]|uniref:GNAT family N-acetyltransferase n=1 Tax=Neolewinella aurantiaca TaxID=2602767 RepID=A0A5C7FNU3_9BACT|nr:GNAT family N-acetyltransferase [Neolewinella aurantiaca]TXF89280.1 GNAT family N-acetyltransferase [Neolewinella aurantiaca]
MIFEHEIKPPADCTAEELEDFYEMCKEADQVSLINLKDRILNCPFLAFARHEEKIAGIAAIKVAGENYRQRTFTASKTTLDNKLFPHEVGYVYTKPFYQKNGIGSTLADMLISKFTDQNLFATTGNPTMKRILEKGGFGVAGSSYPGDHNDTLELLVRDNSFTH